MAFDSGFEQLGPFHVGVPYQGVKIVVVLALFLGGHAEILQPLAGLLQARNGSVRTDVFVLQVVHPFLQGGDGKLVELVYADDEILGEHVLRHHDLQVFTFVFGQLQRVVGVYSLEGHLTVVQVVFALAQLEIEDIDAEHLLHLAVVFAATYMLGDGFCNAVEHTLKVVELAGLLNLYENDFTLGVLCLDVYAVLLVMPRLLVGLALQKLDNRYLLADKRGDETLKDDKVGLVAKHVLGRPVETYVLVLSHNVLCFECKGKHFSIYCQIL